MTASNTTSYANYKRSNYGSHAISILVFTYTVLVEKISSNPSPWNEDTGKSSSKVGWQQFPSKASPLLAKRLDVFWAQGFFTCSLTRQHDPCKSSGCRRPVFEGRTYWLLQSQTTKPCTVWRSSVWNVFLNVLDVSREERCELRSFQEDLYLL